MDIGARNRFRGWVREWRRSAAWLDLHSASRVADSLEGFLGLPHETLLRYIRELGFDLEFLSYLALKRREAMKIEPRVAGWMPYPLLFCLYAIVRWRKPETFVETGVGPGSSSSFILRAMQKNGIGQLVSIDLPGHDAVVYPGIGKQADVHIPHGFSTGWLILPSTRSRWDLRLGDSRTILPQVLEETGRIDAFLHDSLHTYEQMTFEYSEAYPRLREGGLLLSDDVTESWSLAFVDFCRKRGVPFTILDGRLGVARVQSPTDVSAQSGQPVS